MYAWPVDDLARTNSPHNNYDNYSSQGGQQQGTDDGVRGAPIEGDGVKVVISAPEKRQLRKLRIGRAQFNCPPRVFSKK